MNAIGRYLRYGCKLVKGWMQPGAARMVRTISEVQIEAGVQGNIAEIGVHHGKLFVLLYLLTREIEVAVAIDLFEHPYYYGGDALQTFHRNMRRWADEKRLVVHQGDSTKVGSAELLELAGGSCRLISVDGGHTKEITTHDLETAEGALSDGGVIILDDCFDEMWAEV
jgi:hypothetical protein